MLTNNKFTPPHGAEEFARWVSWMTPTQTLGARNIRKPFMQSRPIHLAVRSVPTNRRLCFNSCASRAS